MLALYVQQVVRMSEAKSGISCLGALRLWRGSGVAIYWLCLGQNPDIATFTHPGYVYGRRREAFSACSALISFIYLRAIAAKIPELSRSPDQPTLAELPFFVGCRRVTQAVDFLTCHLCRLRSFLGTHSCRLGDRKRELEKPADGFGARWIVLLRRRPSIDAHKCSGLKTQADQPALAGKRRPPLLSPYRHRSTCHGKP
jgi:hypothetical protein